MGPYAKYGLVGAGAGLLFYAFGAQKGGPVSTPGSSCKLTVPTRAIVSHWVALKRALTQEFQEFTLFKPQPCLTIILPADYVLRLIYVCCCHVTATKIMQWDQLLYATETAGRGPACFHL